MYTTAWSAQPKAALKTGARPSSINQSRDQPLPAETTSPSVQRCPVAVCSPESALNTQTGSCYRLHLHIEEGTCRPHCRLSGRSPKSHQLPVRCSSVPPHRTLPGLSWASGHPVPGTSMKCWRSAICLCWTVQPGRKCLPYCWQWTLRARFLKMCGAVLPLKSTQLRHLNSFKIWP